MKLLKFGELLIAESHIVSVELCYREGLADGIRVVADVTNGDGNPLSFTFFGHDATRIRAAISALAVDIPNGGRGHE